jgi:hypothetical protein
MPIIRLLHGSDHIIKTPIYSLGKPHNDYGQGFYCTENLEMAKQWACKENKNGFVNKYDFNLDGLNVLNLLDGKHSVLNWIALLLKNRIFTLQDEIAIDAKNYIIEHFLMDLSNYDVVIGYRADDSYFSYAQSFVSNTLPLRGLNQALKLGKLGIQTALISEKAFKNIKFVDAEVVNKEEYYPKFLSRDLSARATYQKEIKKSPSYKDDIFVMDILREEIKNDDPRIQRIIFE